MIVGDTHRPAGRALGVSETQAIKNQGRLEAKSSDDALQRGKCRFC